jgi:hypothetical protein
LRPAPTDVLFRFWMRRGSRGPAPVIARRESTAHALENYHAVRR